jgi:hypothetical protein
MENNKNLKNYRKKLLSHPQHVSSQIKHRQVMPGNYTTINDGIL